MRGGLKNISFMPSSVISNFNSCSDDNYLLFTLAYFRHEPNACFPSGPCPCIRFTLDSCVPPNSHSHFPAYTIFAFHQCGFSSGCDDRMPVPVDGK